MVVLRWLQLTLLLLAALLLMLSSRAEEGNSISSIMGLSPKSRRLPPPPPPPLRLSFVEGRSLGRRESWPREPRLKALAPASGPRPPRKEACRWYISSGGRGRSTAMLGSEPAEPPDTLEPEVLLVGDSVRRLLNDVSQEFKFFL